MKVFISIPMKGKTDEEIKKDMNDAIERIKEQFPNEEVEIIDSFIKEDPPENVNIPVWYMSKSIELLATADYAYFCKGWNKTAGCRIENQVVYSYGIKFTEEW